MVCVKGNHKVCSAVLCKDKCISFILMQSYHNIACYALTEVAKKDWSGENKSRMK